METTMAPHHRITGKGALDDGWSAWFDGLALAQRRSPHVVARAVALAVLVALLGMLARPIRRRSRRA
jgi:hypothetical protein